MSDKLTVFTLCIGRRWPFFHLERTPREAWGEIMQVRQRDGESDEMYQTRREVQAEIAELRENVRPFRAIWGQPGGKVAILLVVTFLLAIICAALYAVVTLAQVLLA